MSLALVATLARYNPR